MHTALLSDLTQFRQFWGPPRNESYLRVVQHSRRSIDASRLLSAVKIQDLHCHWYWHYKFFCRAELSQALAQELNLTGGRRAAWQHENGSCFCPGTQRKRHLRRTN